jgi:hypothetical protein
LWLRVLRNPVYLDKTAGSDDLHDGKHEATVDESVFASAQSLLNERAVESTTIRPTTSEYLRVGSFVAIAAACSSSGLAHSTSWDI